MKSGRTPISDWEIHVGFPEKNRPSLLVRDRRVSLKRGEDGAFFTVDIYPEHKPRYPSRHFGTWQFPLKDEPSFGVTVTREGITLSSEAGTIEPSQVIEGRLREDDLYKISLVVYDGGFNKLAETSYFQIIAERPEALNPAHYWPGLKQRSPSRSEPAYLSLKGISEAIREFVATSVLDGGSRVLDFGCAHKAYYPFFSPTGCEYIGTDIYEGQFVDVVYRAGGPVPFESGYFDLAISTQVLEHVQEPAAVVGEIHRVLKPGGSLLLSAPFAWEQHDYPSDYWRFSEEGLRRMFGRFAQVEVRPTGDSAQCLAELHNLHDHRNRRDGLHRKMRIYMRNWLGERLAARRTSRDFSMPSNYVVIARKRE